MKNSFFVFPFLVAAAGCNFGTSPSVVYYSPPPKVTTVVVEEKVTYPVCDPYSEVYGAPFHHNPAFCTDYGVGEGYCCTWEYIDNFGSLCAHESCFWEDVCHWEPIIDECILEVYY